MVITLVTLQQRPVAEVARDFGVARSWISELLAHYRDDGGAAFVPRSRRRRTVPTATSVTVELVVRPRKQVTDAGHDAGADTVRWHLDLGLSRATINRILVRHRQVAPDPAKRPNVLLPAV